MLCPGLQTPLTLAFQRFGATPTRGLWPRRMIQRRIPAQARDHNHLAPHTGQGQRHGGKAAINGHDQPAPGQSVAYLHAHLPDPIDTGLVPALAMLVSGQDSAVINGNAHTRRLQGTATKSIIVTHFRPKQRSAHHRDSSLWL